jgi:hypothetical protein
MWSNGGCGGLWAELYQNYSHPVEPSPVLGTHPNLSRIAAKCLSSYQDLEASIGCSVYNRKKSLFLPADLSPKAIDQLRVAFEKKASDIVSPMTGLHVEFAQWDGRATNPAKGTAASAFCHRNASWLVHITAAFVEPTPAPIVASLVGLLESIHAELVSEYWQDHTPEGSSSTRVTQREAIFEDYQNVSVVADANIKPAAACSSLQQPAAACSRACACSPKLGTGSTRTAG